MAALTVLLLVPVSQAAALSIPSDGFAVRVLDAGGNPENASGSHPDRIQIDFKLETEGAEVGAIAVDLPPGFRNNVEAVPACPRQAHEEGEECSPESQVGVVSFGSSGTPQPVYLLEPLPGQIAAFTSTTGLQIPFELKLRPEDFGATFAAEDLASGAPSEGHFELWGVPADHQASPPPGPHKPFLALPGVCGPLTFTLRARAAEEGAPWAGADAQTAPLVGCQDLSFEPRLGMQLSTPIADSPTGVRVVLNMPPEDESGPASAALKDATIEMPADLTVSPGGAAGLATCSDAQFDVDAQTEPRCPAASRVGAIEMTSSLLSDPVAGTVYMAEPRGEERFRIFVVAPGGGVFLKFVTSLAPNPTTGRLTATLHDLPQAAIQQIAISLGGGSNSLLASPLACGPASGIARFTSYAGGPPVTSTATANVATLLPGLTCPGPLFFGPQLSMSGSSRKAGAATSFSAAVIRRGGEALPRQFSLTLPAGLSVALGTLETCADSPAATGGCPAASRLGSVTAAVGSGTRPALLPGTVYLAGPWHRSPLSLVLALHGSIGPFNLGTVAIRAGAQVDGRTGRLTVTTDHLPAVVEGVPIRFQRFELTLDRPGMVRNPTSCDSHTLDGTFSSQEGVTATASSPYPVSGCKRLGFRPRVKLALRAGSRPRRGSEVGLELGMRFRRGDTAMRSLSFSLPPALRLNVGGLKQICSRPDARRGLCPADSRVGTAVARTAMFDKPLRGAVNVVRPRGNGEPDMWLSLSAGGSDLAIQGTSAKRHGRFVANLAGLPDMPIDSLSLRLGSSGDSLLSLGAGPCAPSLTRRDAAQLDAVGQNGARRKVALPLVSSGRCGSARQR